MTPNTPHGARSFYEELRAADDHESGADEENLRQDLEDVDLEQATALIEDSHATVDSPLKPATALHHPSPTPTTTTATDQTAAAHLRPPKDPPLAWPMPDDDIDNEVPASLLIEHNKHGRPSATKAPSPQGPGQTRPHPVLGAPQLEPGSVGPAPPSGRHPVPAGVDRSSHDRHSALPSDTRPVLAGIVAGSPKEQALWHWVNITNMDHFIMELYDYYEGCGMWCILCDRALRLLETSFMMVLLTFLSQCVDYGRLRGSNSLSQVVIAQCTTKMSTLWSVGVWLYVFYFIWKAVQFSLDTRRLLRVRAFFAHLLNIPERDMQTVSWQDIVARVMALRDANPRTATNIPQRLRKFILGSQSKERLDAHDIANRLLRKENYLIAMINKDMLDLSLPIPFLRERQFFSRTLEWCLQFSILEFVFNHEGQVRQEFLKSSRRAVLSQKLRQRFVFAGILNLIFAPFVMGYLIIIYIFTYYQEYQKNPSILGTRRYTALAEWKFRNFNELPHMFRERINMSYPFANRYVTQFPKQMTEQIARTVAFVTGALVAVLAAMTLHDSEFLNLEIIHDRTVLFFITILGAIWAAARNSISEDTAVFSPEYALRNVIEYTRYLPDHWQGRLHSAEVLAEFSDLYKLKWIVVLEELLGIVTAPCVLLFSLPKCSDQIVDFFREFTIHVDGLGYVCSFAVFDFKKAIGDEAGQQQRQQRQHQPESRDVRDEYYYSTKHNKMAMSYYGFIDNYVTNPKTGIPGHTPLGLRHQFHPPPQFPGLGSSALAGEMQGSRLARGSIMLDRDARTRTRGPSGRIAPPAGLSSPMGSILLDPHHQPSISMRGGGGGGGGGPSGGAMPMTRNPRAAAAGGHHGEEGAAHATFEAVGGGDRRAQEYDEPYEPGGVLGESVWETSPPKGLSRESSGAAHHEEPETGVLGLIYQLQHAQRPQRNTRVL